MHIRYVAVIALLLAMPVFAQVKTKTPTPSPLDQQLASLQVDVPRVREIMKLVATNGQQPTKQIHDEFWGLILTRIHADPNALQKALTESVDKAMVFQIAFWESLHSSAQAHRVIMTKEFLELRNNYPASKFSSDYAREQNAMLSAAAKGQPYILRSGNTLNITAQLAEEKLNNMKATKLRLEKLCNPNWQR